MDELMHDFRTGPMSEDEAVQASHQGRLAVAGQKIDPQFDQISEFQRHVRMMIESKRNPPWRPEVQELWDVIQVEPFVRMYAELGLEQIRPMRKHFDDLRQMLDAINYVTHIAPIFRDTDSISWQFPLSAIMNFWMGTPAGKRLMRMPQFNTPMNKIMKRWCDFLNTEESLYVLNQDQYGWLQGYDLDRNSPEYFKSAWYYNRLDEYEVDMSKPHGGFDCYNAFFHRMIRPDVRPVSDPHTNQTICSPNDGVAWALQRFVQKQDAFWLKSQAYSMANLLAQSEFTDRFVGGDVYQTYVNGGADWHGFSSPINGKLVGLKHIEGYAWAESQVVGPDPMSGPYSQGWAAGVATRGLVFIESDDEYAGLVCVIPIGLTEVSSLEWAAGLTVGQDLKKGDLLGNFSFGGSSFAMVFEPNAVRQYDVLPPTTGRNSQSDQTLFANKAFATAHTRDYIEYKKTAPLNAPPHNGTVDF
ncbi:MAG: phophatidylserine decarboxylase associated domain-containing protein [Pseudomonadota bacterium]